VTAVRNLALDIYDTLQPNAPLKAIEKRVWMLKCRNIPDKTVFSIVKEEYAPETAVSQSFPSGGASIIVEYLPERFRRDDWR
jgi:hypothetical protein